MLEMVLRQERHWIVMLVAFARMAEALIIMPGIFTNLAICSDWKWIKSNIENKFNKNKE